MSALLATLAAMHAQNEGYYLITLILIKGACIVFIEMPDSNKTVKKQLLGSLFRRVFKGIIGGGGGHGGHNGKRTHAILRPY